MEISSHHSRLLQQLNEQRRQDLFCDCHIVIQGKSFKAHRNVLFASSGYFKMLLSQSSREPCQPTTATFEVFSPETFHVILDFIYTGKLSLNGQTVIEVMSAASYLQMTDIIGACKTFINSSLDINEKEQDGFYSNQEKNSQEERLYNTGWKVENSPPHHQPAPDQGEFIVSSSSWDHHAGQLSSQIIAQQQPPYVDQQIRKWGPLRKSRRQVGRPPFQDTDLSNPRTPGGGPGSSKALPPSDTTSPARVIIEIDEDDEPAQTDAPQRHEIGKEEQDPPMASHMMLADAYSAVVSVMGGYGEDGQPRIRFKCPHCPHTVKRKADMKRHLRCHTGERPFPCPACGKGFTRLEHLRGHYQTIHEACKLVCRKCKRPVTEATGRVVQQGTRRYRLCHGCLEDIADDIIPVDGNEEWSRSSTADEKVSQWLLGQEHGPAPELADDDGSSDLIIHEVNDSDNDVEETDMKPDINKLSVE
ncbi:zinc finger and BTB domain-containing protein 8A-like [Ambystoma mexicanum]|uniref:zinc finger and BTB domain-containing protein 8A-like n=1 Tax=Ambystoma mexicanum TaxID=8296 RepID=UPI0037E8DE5C